MHTEAFQFDRFKLLPTERLLLVDGEPAKLGGRAFDLLLALVERRERTVTRSELFDLVWAGRIVEDHNLQVQVLALRKVLGPNAIATIPGRGYRFAMALDAPVQAAPAPSTSAVPAANIAASPPRSGAVPMTNLTAAATLLHGRVNDIAAVCRLLGEHRLVTVAGSGGIGKTRLAQAVANQLRPRFGDGVWMVELASLSDDPELLCGALAGVLALTQGSVTTVETIARAIAPLEMLLVLDNCEHLVPSAAALARALLERAPKVRVLATSQEPLHTSGEHVYRLGPLTVPAATVAASSTAERTPESGALTLFVERVQAADRRFEVTETNRAAVVEICRRLDGIPLAIELAAARIPLLGVDGVRSRLDERFRLLTGGASDAPRRQRTLIDTIEWSHSLLSADEQAVFRRLGVFVGSFSLAAARLVAGSGSLSEWEVLDHLGALVDKSLVLVEGSGASGQSGDSEPRYRMLESTRAYALEALDACDETVATRRRHARVMLDIYTDGDDTYYTEPTLPWLERLGHDLHNCRDAFAFSMSSDGEPAVAVGIAATAANFAAISGRGREGHRALVRAWPLLNEHATPAWRARAWLGLAHLGGVQAITPTEAMTASREAADGFRAIDDRVHLYRALYLLSQYAENSAEAAMAEAAGDEMRSIESSEASDEWPVGIKRLGRLRDARRMRRLGRIGDYRDAFADDAKWCLAAGDEHRAWLMQHHVALAELSLGNAEQAVQVMQQVAAQIRARGMQREMWQQVAMHALAHIEHGELATALPAVREAVTMLRVQGAVWWLADHLAWLPQIRGESADAARLQGWADAQAAARSAKRGPVMQKARDRLAARLEENLAADELLRLRGEGAALRDDEVLRLALREHS